ncbi:MAG: cobaltochelatase subunit CobN, partial [Rhodobacteraceae bacterium]|nr:cobaltochelatase subunit CobN [Paracoccaceae bacterium]
RTLRDQIALETRSRALNPKFYEALLEHKAEGVRQLEAQVTNTLGWSATTGTVEPWVYQRLSETFVLDEAMRRRLAELNPQASARMAGRLIEASERNYWQPDAATLAALQDAADEIEDRVEGIAAE